MILGRTFYFDAAHHLPDKPCYGNCSKIHGHTYRFQVEIEGDLQSEGWVINFKAFGDIINQVISRFDHDVINNIIEVPTAENMLLYFKTEISNLLPYGISLHSLKLYEGNNTYAKILCK